MFCDYIFEEQAVADAGAAVVVDCHLLFVKEIFSGPAEKVFLVQAKNVSTAQPAQPAHLPACPPAYKEIFIELIYSIALAALLGCQSSALSAAAPGAFIKRFSYFHVRLT